MFSCCSRWMALGALVTLTCAISWADSGPAASQGAAHLGSSAVSNAEDCDPGAMNSPYIPVDSWAYPAVMRLYSLGFIDSAYLGMRPWTRSSVLNMLEEVDSRLEDDDTGNSSAEARHLYRALQDDLHRDVIDPCAKPERHLYVESLYSVMRGMSGTPLRDSYH